MYETRSRFGNTTPVLKCARHHRLDYGAALYFVDALVHGRYRDGPRSKSTLAARRDLIEIANDMRRAMGRDEVMA